MQLIDPTWSFIDATSSMVFHIYLIVLILMTQYLNRIKFGSNFVLRSFNARCPASSYIMQQNPSRVKQVREI